MIGIDGELRISYRGQKEVNDVGMRRWADVDDR